MIRLAANALRQFTPAPMAAVAKPPPAPRKPKAPIRHKPDDAEVAERMDKLYACIRDAAASGQAYMPAGHVMARLIGVQTQGAAQKYIRRLVQDGRLSRELRGGKMQRFYIYRITATGQRLRARIALERA